MNICREVQNNVKLKQPLYENIRWAFSATPLLLLSSCITIPLLLIPMIMLAMLRSITGLFLKYRYGTKYGGMMQSADAIWAVEDHESKAIINTLLIVNSNTKDLQKFSDKIKQTIDEKIFRKSNDFPKLTSLRSSCMGFTFLIKGEFVIEECISMLNLSGNEDTYINQSTLTKLLSDYSNKPLPKNNQALWEVVIFPKQIRWNKEQNEISTQVPLLVRFSHIVGDGLSLINFLLRNFADNTTILPRNIMNSSLAIGNEPTIIYNRLKEVIKWTVRYVYIILMTPPIQLRQNFLLKPDVNCLHGSKLSGKKILVYSVEKRNVLVPLVKEMKNRIPNTTFSDIIYTAISSCLSEHFQKNSSVVPKSTTVAVPALLSAPDAEEAIELKNRFSMGLLELPVSSEPQSMMMKLEDIKNCSNKLRSAPDYQVNDLLLKKLCGIIPAALLKQCIRTNNLTMTISNVPGIPKVSIFDGCVVEDVVFFTPHRGTVGVGFSILTYDNRFQLGLAVDEAVLSSYAEAQLIVDNISRQIYALCDEFTEQILPSTKVKG